jgi:phage shock protein A
MKKSKRVELDSEQLDRVVSMAQEERKPFEVLKAEFAEQKSQLEKKITELESKVKQGFAQVAELVEALSNTPTAEPTQKSANAFQSYISSNDIKYERLEKYRNAILNK